MNSLLTLSCLAFSFLKMLFNSTLEFYGTMILFSVSICKKMLLFTNILMSMPWYFIVCITICIIEEMTGSEDGKQDKLVR
jgi:hypothetical protein